jgi:hypothetical protein
LASNYVESLKSEVIALSRHADAPDFSNIEVIKYNLIFLHQVMTATEGMLQEAINHSKGKLREYFTTHLIEERGHAEWLEADLKHLDIDVKSIPIKRHAAAMAGAQYYLIKHVKPECLLGYMAVIEGFPAPLGFVEYLESIHGKEAFKTLRFHAEHDIEHRKELFDVIEEFQCSEILENALETQTYLNELSHVLRYIK